MCTEKYIQYFSEQTGHPCKSFPPWPPQHLPGGGAVIPCAYHIRVKDACEQSVLDKVRAAVELMDEKCLLKINFA